MRNSWSEGALPRSVTNVGQGIAVNLAVFVWMETAVGFFITAHVQSTGLTFRRSEHGERRASFPDLLEILGKVIYSQSRDRNYI
jgi:hypothetical protein